MFKDLNSSGLSFKSTVTALFLALMFCLSFNGIFRMGVNIYWSDIFVISIMAVTVLLLVQKKDINKYHPFFFLFAVLGLYCLFLIFYSYSILGNGFDEVFGRFRNLYFYPLTFISGMVAINKKENIMLFLTAIKIYIVTAVVLGVLGIKYPIFRLARIYARGKVSSIVSEPLYYMIVDHVTALLCCFIIINEILNLLIKTEKKIKSLFFLSIALVGIIGTQNRSIYIVFLMALVLIAWFGRKGEKKVRARIKIVLIIVIILVICSIILLLNSPVMEKFQRRIDETVNTFTGEKYFFNTITGVRIGRTIATFKEWQKTPILGCGWGNQITRYNIYDFQGNYVRTNYGTPHNYYMTLLYQTGIIGFIIMISIFYFIFKRLKPQDKLNSRNKMEYTLYIFYIIFLIFNVANTHLYSHPVFIPLNFFLFGVAVSFASIKNKGQSNHDE